MFEPRSVGSGTISAAPLCLRRYELRQLGASPLHGPLKTSSRKRVCQEVASPGGLYPSVCVLTPSFGLWEPLSLFFLKLAWTGTPPHPSLQWGQPCFHKHFSFRWGWRLPRDGAEAASTLTFCSPRGTHSPSTGWRHSDKQGLGAISENKTSPEAGAPSLPHDLSKSSPFWTLVTPPDLA